MGVTPTKLHLPPRVWKTPRCVTGVGLSHRLHRLHQHCAVRHERSQQGEEISRRHRMVECHTTCLDTMLRNAKRAAVELPRSLLDVWLVWPAETNITNLWWYGAPWSKTTIWRTRGLRRLVPSSAALTAPAGGFPSLSHTVFDHDDDERRRKRSTYDMTYAAGVVGGWDLLATFGSSIAANDVPPFDDLRDAVASKYVAYGGTLPAGWQSQWALPPGGDVSASLLTYSVNR